LEVVVVRLHLWPVEELEAHRRHHTLDLADRRREGMQVAAGDLAPWQRDIQCLTLQRRRPLARDQRMPTLFELALQRGLPVAARVPAGLALPAGELAQPLEDRAQLAALASKITRAPVVQRLGCLDARKPRRRARA